MFVTAIPMVSAVAWPLLVLQNSVCNRRFGELLPTMLSRPLDALSRSAAATSAGCKVGYVSRFSSAAPSACGDAIDVPLIVLVAVVPVYQAEVMFTPGAN